MNDTSTTSTATITPAKIDKYGDVIYPLMTGLKNEAIQNSFNHGIREDVENEIKLYSQFANEFKNSNDDNAIPSSFELNYQIVYQNIDYISIKFTGYVYIPGAAHGNNVLFSYNFDLKNGKEINLEDLFKPNSNYLVILSDYVTKELNNQPSDLWKLSENGALPKTENFKIFNISKNGLLFTFGDYQLSNYATGPQTIWVPYEYLKDTLTLQI